MIVDANTSREPGKAHVSLCVSALDRSVAFYEVLFGRPEQLQNGIAPPGIFGPDAALPAVLRTVTRSGYTTQMAAAGSCTPRKMR